MKDNFLINDPNDYLVLVNKNNKLPNDYIPKDLEQINTKYCNSKQYMRSKAKQAFESMAKDIEKHNMKIFAVSTYRSYEYQDKLFNNYVKEKGIKYANRCSAKAGHSEHQTGLAVDIANITLDYDNFDKTDEFNWVKENAHKYGFIMRYPKNKEDITGYKYEPWHFRYVGDIAKYIYNTDLTFEEYKKLNE